MIKWSKQGFLNPASSNDDGWFKFSIRPKFNKWGNKGLDIQYIISDCSNKIYLEFGPDNVYLDSAGGLNDLSGAKSALASIKTRRKKIRLFASAVAQSAEKIEAALDAYEEQILTLIENHKNED